MGEARLGEAYLNCVVSAGKYFPEFRAELGPSFDEFRQANVEGIVRATKYAIDKTATARVIPFQTLEGLLSDAKKKFGETSFTYVLALLQLKLIALRGELGSVRVVDSGKPSIEDAPNYYRRDKGKLVIRKFKTSQHFKPYRFLLTPDLKAVVEKSLEKRRRDYLIGMRPKNSSQVGQMLKNAIGVKVNHVRHSMITMLLTNDHTEANARKIAQKFKHSWTMTMRYFNHELREEPGADADIISDDEAPAPSE